MVSAIHLNVYLVLHVQEVRNVEFAGLVIFVGDEYGYGDLESMKKEGGRVFVKTTAELLDVLTK